LLLLIDEQPSGCPCVFVFPITTITPITRQH
jgi:hypothetical protein